MCLVCHGPIPRRGRGRGVTASTCHENCRCIWRRVARGADLPERYLYIRWHHQQRREHIAVLLRLIGIANVLDLWKEGQDYVKHVF